MKLIYSGQDVPVVNIEGVDYDKAADGTFDVPDDVAERLLAAQSHSWRSKAVD